MKDLELLKVYHFDKKFRCGEKRDGGYVIGVLDDKYDCYISAGVGCDESFSRDFLNMDTNEHLNKDNCFAFDGTVHDYPYHFTDKISFVRKNIGHVNNETTTNLSDLFEKYDKIFLKMDIEAGEYPWILSLNDSQLNKFKQIVIEFHGITNDGWNYSYDDKMKCLQKLQNTHYIIHAHGNNCGPLINGIPDTIELTYVNKNYFTPDSIPKLNELPLPAIGLDYPNSPELNEFDLNMYPFVNVI